MGWDYKAVLFYGILLTIKDLELLGSKFDPSGELGDAEMIETLPLPEGIRQVQISFFGEERDYGITVAGDSYSSGIGPKSIMLRNPVESSEKLQKVLVELGLEARDPEWYLSVSVW